MLKIIPRSIFIITGANKIKALNLLNANNTQFYKSFINEIGELVISISYFKKAKLELLLKENDIPYSVSIKKGLLSFLLEHKHRIGFLVGCLLLVICTLFSGKFVWRIDIQGNYKTTNEEIIEDLQKVGFSLGSYISRLDYNDLHNKFLIESKSISWISVNIKGNVATVMVREKEIGSEANKSKYTNIVAKEDGQIKLISVIDGKKQISIGDVVKKGDLLISGVINSQSQGVRYVNADGSVIAYVNKDLEISIPLKRQEKRYTNDVKKETKYIFFNNIINLFKNNNKNDELYDIIEKTEFIYLFGKIKLPIQRVIKQYYSYEFADVQYTRDYATSLAVKELNEKIDIISANSQIISKDVKTTYENNQISIKCNLYCLEDITKSIEFYVETK